LNTSIIQLTEERGAAIASEAEVGFWSEVVLLQESCWLSRQTVSF
jgi:hypothetical protein